jgi:hypothetical protein
MPTPLSSEHSPEPARQLELEEIRDLAADDLRDLDQCIATSLASDVMLVNQVARYIVAGGGKRLRPLLVLLAARACGYPGAEHVDPPRLSNSSTRPRCCTTTSSTVRTCAAAGARPIPSSAARPACWWAISSIRGPSR